jgi:hypothetical protein
MTKRRRSGALKHTKFVLVTALMVSAAWAGALPNGSVVRIEGSGIEAGWHPGKTSLSGEGCTMVVLDKATKDGYTMIALIAVTRLQRQNGGAWSDIKLADLLAKEPKPCLEEGSD